MVFHPSYFLFSAEILFLMVGVPQSSAGQGRVTVSHSAVTWQTGNTCLKKILNKKTSGGTNLLIFPLISIALYEKTMKKTIA